LEPSEAKRLKALEGENAKLKRLMAEAMLDNTASMDLRSKSGNACRKARGCRPSRTGLRDERAAGVFPDRGRSVIDAVSEPTAG
jgi:hypothetical protein